MGELGAIDYDSLFDFLYRYWNTYVSLSREQLRVPGEQLIFVRTRRGRVLVCPERRD